MSITFACDQCRKSYDVDEAHAGKRVKCKACGASLTVPNRSSASASAVKRPAGSAVGSPAAPKKPPPPADDLDDPYGFGEAAPAAHREAGGETLIPRGRPGQRSGAGQQSSGGVPAWVWLLAGGVGLALVFVVLVVVLTRGPKTGPVAQRDANGEAVAPIGSEPAETPANATPTGAPAPGFQRDATTVAPTMKTWRVKPDPAPLKPEYPPIAKLQILVPEHFGGEPIVYPTTPSPFVILGGNENDDHYREVWDLRGPTRIARLKGHMEVAKPMALSPDGAYFVVHANPVPRFTDVWKVADGQRVGRIADGDKIPDFIDFVGPGDGKVVIGSSYGKILQVWDFLNGKPTVKVETPANFETKSVTFSPGRKYMALTIAQKNRLMVYDMTKGWVAGDFEMEKEGTWNYECEGLAFSADATSLAGFFTLHNKSFLKVWDTATGKLVSDFSAEGDEAYGKEHVRDDQNIQWLPDESGWLVNNQTIVERQSGQIAWTLPFNPIKYNEHGPRRILDLGRIIMTVESNGREALRLVPLPQAKIQTALTLARGGGSAVDATLPPITASDLAAAKKIAPPTAAVAWKAVAGSAAPAKAPASGKSISLKTTAGDILTMLAAGPDATQVILVSSPGGRLGDKKGKQSQEARTVDRYDLATGRPLGKFEIPSVSTPVAMTPTGSHVLLSHAGGLDRVDVMATDGGKHVAGWRPYDKESGDDRNVVWADFLDARRVLTVNKAGTLVLWTIPDCKAVYVAPQAAEGAAVLSPDKKVLAVHRGEALRLIDPETGATLGDAPTSGHKGENGLQAAAFDPEGRELAAVLDGNLVRWDLKTGQVVGEFPSPAPKAVSLQYGADRHALLDGKVLVDLEHKHAVWYYAGGVHAPSGTGALHRYVAGPIIGPSTLGTLEIPDRRTARAEAAISDPRTKPLLHEGSKVSLQIVGGPPRDVDRFKQELTAGLTARFQAVGVEVAADQPVRLVVNFKETDTGQTIELRKLGGAPNTPPEVRNMAIRKIDWELSVTDDKGAAVPIIKERAGSHGPGLITHLPPGENDWEGYLRTQQWMGAASEVAQHVLPFFVARGTEGGVFLPGWTFLGHPTF